MAGQQRSGLLRVARLARGHDRLVLVVADLPGARRGAEQARAAIALAAVEDRVDDALHRLAALEQPPVEVAVHRLPGAAGPARRRLAHGLEVGAQRLVIGRRHAWHGEADRQRLEEDAAGIDRVDVLRVERSDARAAVVLGGQEPLSLQQPHGLAQRRGADPELTGQLDLGDHGARRDLAVEHRLAQVGVDVLGAADAVCSRDGRLVGLRHGHKVYGGRMDVA